MKILPKLLNDLASLNRKNENWKGLKTCSQIVWKKEYVVRIRTLKQTLNHESVLKNIHTVIKFNQKF